MSPRATRAPRAVCRRSGRRWRTSSAEPRILCPDRFRCRVEQGLRGVHGLRLRPYEDLPGPQRGPGGLGPAVPRLRDRGTIARHRGARGPFRIEKIVLLRTAAPPVALRPEDLSNLEAFCGQIGRQARPERAGALDADGGAARRFADGAGELAVAPCRSWERCGEDLSAEGVKDAQDMGVLVRIDSREDRDCDGFHAYHPVPRRFGHAGRTVGHNTDGGVECSCRGPFRAHAPMRSWPAPDARGGARRVFPKPVP